MNADAVAEFVARWLASGASERANKDLFLTELCDVLGVPRPDPSTGDPDRDLYVFERDSVIQVEGGKCSVGHIDLYRDGRFVLEAKQGSAAGAKKAGTARRETPGWTLAMQAAFGQALSYARTLTNPPPFIIVADIGHCFDLYASFDGSTNYRPFPRPQGSRIFFKELGNHVETLRRIWTEPMGLDPTRNAARVTREIAERLAELARSLEGDGHSAEKTASFLMRVLFTMFAEDAGLLPKHLFTKLLEERWVPDPSSFVPEVENLWQTMRTGGHIVGLGRIRKFNGGFFNESEALSLTEPQLRLLLEAGRASWTEVEPAIFGTLLERALVPKERHALGAHFTPRAYVERLVRPTIEEPLRSEWDLVRAQVHALVKGEKVTEALKVLRAFHERLCHIRVLDPACGTGNFLYVALDLLKRLESEVLGLLQDLGEAQGLLDLHGVTVSPAQLLGIEINPRAREIAELVLWIGFLRWQYGNLGKGATIPEPVLHDYGNIECRDALVAWDRVEPVMEASGKQATRWDGETTKLSPVTGEAIPDESARLPVFRYVAPRKATWPDADFVIGNPPFVGSKLMRSALGDEYIDAVQAAWPEIPQASDLVLRWWHHAAVLCREGRIRRFGLITTNSISQSYNRRVIEPHIKGVPPLSIAFAIPDHPWVESADGAAVRIAMTVGVSGEATGLLCPVLRERATNDERGDDDLVEALGAERGRIGADLRIGADVAGARPLASNRSLCSVGMKTIGAGFQISRERALELGLERDEQARAVIRPYLNGRDLASTPRGLYVIDTFGLSEKEVRDRVPAVYQHLDDRVHSERLVNRNRIFREYWWVIGHPRPQFRAFVAGLDRYIATIETAKHRFFVFLPAATVPDSTLVTFGSSDAAHLGVLSSRAHVVWSLSAGGTLEDRPRYNKTVCFEPFPFPDLGGAKRTRIRQCGEALDAHRKKQRSLHPTLTLTGVYNVLEKVRAGEPLTAKEHATHEQGLVTVLRELHDELDAAVFEAYGWPANLTDEEILARLVALNAERAEEERRGLVRWLRPEFQNPAGKRAEVQEEIEVGIDEGEEEEAPIAAKTPSWPKALPDRIAMVRDWAVRLRGPVTVTDAAGSFAGARPSDVEPVLDSLAALGILRSFEGPAGRLWAASAAG